MAIHGTTCLSGNANGLAVLVRHEHGFNRGRFAAPESPGVFIVSQLQNVAHSAIRRFITSANLWQRNYRFALQAFAQCRGQITHGCEIESSLGIERMINLASAVGRFTERLHETTQLFGRFSKQIEWTHGILRRHIPAMITRARGADFPAPWPQAGDIIVTSSLFPVERHADGNYSVRG